MRTYLSHIGVLSLISAVYAAPATPSTDDIVKPQTPHYRIDLSVVPLELAARDVDVSVDHSLESHNFFGNEEWAVAVRPGVGPIWIHRSRWATLLDDSASPNDLGTNGENSNDTSLEARQYYPYYGTGYGYGYGGGYYQYGSGYYGWYAKKRELEKRAACPPIDSYSYECNSISKKTDTVAMSVVNLYKRDGWAPKMNVYSDKSCNSYMTSVIGDASCVNSRDPIRGVRLFDQKL